MATKSLGGNTSLGVITSIPAKFLRNQRISWARNELGGK
jgi:hypothetical protein